MKISLKNKVVLVTGAAGGIGEAISHVLAKADATVAIHYRSDEAGAKNLAKSCGNGSEIFYADLEDHMQAERLMDSVLKRYGSLDVLVNNAGIFQPARIDDELMWIKNWERTININLRAAAILSRRAVCHYLKSGGGKIIFIASRAAFRGDDPEYLAYAASKAGMVAFSKSIARGFGKNNITSFVVAPGFIRTKMTQISMQKHGENKIAGELALPNLTEPMDVAPTVLFLASGFMDHATGSSIDINGASYVR